MHIDNHTFKQDYENIVKYIHGIIASMVMGSISIICKGVDFLKGDKK